MNDFNYCQVHYKKSYVRDITKLPIRLDGEDEESRINSVKLSKI